MRLLAAALVVAGLGVVSPTFAAPSVTLNGVNIDGVKGQKFENCTVVIDEKGDIHIQAKGYAVKGGAEGAPGTPTASSTRPPALDARASAGGKVARRYFLATDHSSPGTQYDLAIFINAQWIREVKASEPQVVMEITKYLRPGANKVTLAATKRVVGDRLAYGKDVQLRVVVGEGNVGGDHVMIDVPLIETALTAAEIEDRTQEFVIEVR